MLLVEEHKIKKNADKELFKKCDDYCYRAKNLYNATNYLIKQCDRIHGKLEKGLPLEDWEKEMTDQINEGIRLYNAGRENNRQLRYVDEGNGYISDAYFLSWYLKTSKEYRDMPYATCSQICIQELCRSWKSYYKALAAYKKRPEDFTGRPHKPGYHDPVGGRCFIVITSQNFHPEDDGSVRMPGFLKGIRLKARHRNLRQIRVRTEKTHIRVLLTYEETAERSVRGTARGKNTMAIDLGVDNLATVVWDSDNSPVIINGRSLKSINQYYNKERASLQASAKKGNKTLKTRRLERLTAKRNRKVRDHLHKASRRIVEMARATGTGLIIIGNNKGWKQRVDLGNRTNQNFVSIPYLKFIQMISYKAALAGIEVRVVSESYTSGTSYLDQEEPVKASYNVKRRISRGCFRSNTGICVNADVNAAYQIMKAGGIEYLKIKERETVTRIKVA